MRMKSPKYESDYFELYHLSLIYAMWLPLPELKIKIIL